MCWMCALKLVATTGVGAEAGAGQRFNRDAFADAVAARIATVAEFAGSRRSFEDWTAARALSRSGADIDGMGQRLLFLEMLASRGSNRAKPNDPFSSITPGCQRMQNYYFSTCVYAPPMLRSNDPREVPLGERR